MIWTRPFRPILTAGERLLDRALCAAGAVIFSQAPEFFQQYLQRLGGHLAEARRQLEAFAEVASRSGLSLDRLAADAAGQADPALARLGPLIGRSQARVADLAAAEGALRGASVWSRPFVFARHFDPEIGRATAAVFRPAVPTTAEGLVYAVAGMALILLLYHGLVKYPFRHWGRRRRRIYLANS